MRFTCFATLSAHRYDYNFLGLVQQTDDDADVEKELALSDRATFNPEVFFNLLLPPIIFFAGYSMKRVFRMNLYGFE